MIPAEMQTLIARVVARLDEQGTGSRRALADHLTIKPQNFSGWLTKPHCLPEQSPEFPRHPPPLQPPPPDF